MSCRLTTLSLLALPTVVWAAEELPEPIGIAPFVKMLGGLALVLGLLYLAYAASRRGFGMLPGAKDGSIKLVETRPLGGRKFLCLVEVRGQQMLLGISPDRIDHLQNLGQAPETFEAALKHSEENS